jgi:hypothetical protein
MLEFVGPNAVLVGPAGTLPVPPGDEVSLKFAMLFEGSCTELGPLRAAQKYGYSKGRYFQLRKAYRERGGALALLSQRRGPKTNYRRTDEAVRQVIRHRFLDPEASADVIAQKLRQCEFPISTRSVERVIEAYGLQKKTLQVRAGPLRAGGRDAADEEGLSPRTRRRAQHRTGRPRAPGR